MVTEMIVPAPAPIDFRNGKSSNDNWKRFQLQWKNYEIATGLDKKEKMLEWQPSSVLSAAKDKKKLITSSIAKEKIEKMSMF